MVDYLQERIESVLLCVRLITWTMIGTELQPLQITRVSLCLLLNEERRIPAGTYPVGQSHSLD